MKINRLFAGLAVAGFTLLGARAGAEGPVPAQHDVAAKWERDPSTLAYKVPQAQRPHVKAFESAYYVITDKKTGQPKVKRAHSPLQMDSKRTKPVLTMMRLPTGWAQVGLQVDAATVMHATQMASTLWNGNYGVDKDGKPARAPATPPMTVLPFLGKGVEVVQVRQGDYHKNIAPKYLVTGLRPNAQGLAGLRVRLLLPTSAHDGRDIPDARQKALSYAKVDQFRIWQTDPSSSGLAKRQLKVLADAIPSAGQLVTPVDMVLRLKQGELFQLQMDPLPGMTAGPGGFYSGRTVDVQWVDKATFDRELNAL